MFRSNLQLQSVIAKLIEYVIRSLTISTLDNKIINYLHTCICYDRFVENLTKSDRVDGLFSDAFGSSVSTHCIVYI